MARGSTTGAGEAARLFTDAFGEAPAFIARAPGRLEVLGNHLDYNRGCVLSCAIDREVFAAVGPAADAGECELVSTAFPEPITVRGAEPGRPDGWGSYPLGVWAVLGDRGTPCPPFRLAVHGTIPLGAGLSSSAALEVSTGLALRELFALPLTDLDLAQVAQEAERRFAGTACGLLDQLSSLFGREGHLLHIDFADLGVTPIPLPAEPLAWVVTLSGVSHALAESGYNQRRAECEAAAAFIAARQPGVAALRDVSPAALAAVEDELDPVLRRRARHVVSEQARVEAGVARLATGDLEGFGQLLSASHRSSRDDFESSCAELDALVELAAGVPGVLGARLTGGGFGGATLTLLPAAVADGYVDAVRRGYLTPEGEPAVIHTARVAAGARLIDP